jgi:hypothetical protein
MSETADQEPAAVCGRLDAEELAPERLELGVASFGRPAICLRTGEVGECELSRGAEVAVPNQ